VLDGNSFGDQEDVLIKLVYSLLCAAVLTYTAVFAGIGCTFLGQGNQSDRLTKQAQSESVAVEIEPTVAAEPADGTATEEAAIEPELEVAEETILELQAEAEIEPEPENTARSDACDEARKWYNEGLDLSDDSAREATYYQRAIELCPDFSAAHNRLGKIYKNRGEYESALKEFNQAQKWSLLNEPGFDQRGNRSLQVDHFINKGEIYRMQGRYDLAEEQFKRALRINPDSRVAMNQLQYVNKMSGKYDNLLLPFIHLLSSPIFTQTPGMTLPKGVFVAGFMFRYWVQEATLAEDMFIGGVPEIPEWTGRGSSTGRTFPFERTTTVMQTVLDLRYGLTDNFTIGLIPRWSTVWTSMAAFPGVTDKATGLADTNLLTKYQFWATRNTRISLYHLLSIPTGDENKVVWPGATIPLGSGSFNFRPGIAFTTKKEYLAAPLTIHSNISYRITNGEQVGDELRCDLAITYPFSPDINTTMELNYRWRDSYTHQQTFVTNRFNPVGTTLFHSTIKEKSGQALFLSPGVQFTLYKDIRVNVGVQIPLIKPDGGWAERFVVNFGLKSVWNF